MIQLLDTQVTVLIKDISCHKCNVIVLIYIIMLIYDLSIHVFIQSYKIIGILVPFLQLTETK